VGAQETFISHPVELRDRLLRSIIAVFGVFAVLWFWPGLATIYDLLALPMMRTLPEGTHMIATGVITRSWCRSGLDDGAFWWRCPMACTRCGRS
jgi:Sec-independent protein secretion pathway component TatC